MPYRPRDEVAVALKVAQGQERLEPIGTWTTMAVKAHAVRHLAYPSA